MSESFALFSRYSILVWKQKTSEMVWKIPGPYKRAHVWKGLELDNLGSEYEIDNLFDFIQQI
jgi:hypothetical protein